MARRAFMPTLPPPSGQLPGSAAQGPVSSPRLPGSSYSSPPPSTRQPPSVRPPPSGSLDGARGSAIPAPLDGVSYGAVAQLLDRLAAAAESAFVVAWLESLSTGRSRLEPQLAVRLLRAYRETGRLDRARDLAAQLPSAPPSLGPLDMARLSIERAYVATVDGRNDHAEGELRAAARMLAASPRGAGQREQLDMHLATAELELRLGRYPQATASLRLAEHVSERLEDGAFRMNVGVALGHLAMRLHDPRMAVKHYGVSLACAPARSIAAMRAHGNMAIALASTGRFDEGRTHASQAIQIAAELSPGLRHADAFDVLGFVELAADRPAEALAAVDEAFAILGDLEQPHLRAQLTVHRSWALALLGHGESSAQWLAKAEKAVAELPAVDVADQQELLAVRARVLEACGQRREALDAALPCATRLEGGYSTGWLNLVIGRCALAEGETAAARVAVERAALSGDRHGWIFPERTTSAALWQLSRESGDSRIVRYVERTEQIGAGSLAGPPSVPPPSGVPRTSYPSLFPPPPMSERPPEPTEGEALVYVTTPQGVTRARHAEVTKLVQDADVVVDTLSHQLRVEQREINLERRRALEPLVVQLLRRAKEGLSAEDVLRAAGGPGPESADAEHRVRVLISRVRDLFGDASSIERVRDAGEHGKTRYRIAGTLKFALIEPLFAPGTQE